MRDSRDRQALEADLGRKLVSLPAVEPSPSLRKRVQELIETERASLRRERRPLAAGRSWVARRRFLKVAAASLVMALAGGVASHFLSGSRNLAALGPLLTPRAQAASFQGSDLAFRLGADDLRRVTFEMETGLPGRTRVGTVAVLERPELTADDAKILGARLGLGDQVDVSAYDGPGSSRGLTIVTAAKASVWLDLDLGTWLYTTQGRPWESSGPPPTPGADAAGQSGGPGVAEPIDEAAAQQLAIGWLTTAGQLPPAGYTATAEKNDELWRVVLRPESGPGGLPVVSESPSVWVRLTAAGDVVDAGGVWYAEISWLEARLTGYEAALEALRAGEGEFLARGFQPLQQGVARVAKVGMGYQMAYGLDYTPYLIPVALFSGEYRPEGGQAVPFQAYAPLLVFQTVRNAGNFKLEAALPEARPTAPVLGERPVEVSAAELPALAEFFGAQVVDPGEGVEGSGGGQIATTSWDGGWLWRGEWREPGGTSGSSGAGSAEPGGLSSEQVIDTARSLADALVAGPGLPGQLGNPELASNDEGFAWVSFPLVYDGLWVEGLGSALTSKLSVQVRKSDGAVISVKCAVPMQAGEAAALISAEEAWEKLLDGDALVYVDGHSLQGIPASRFVAEVSTVTTVSLVVTPEYPRMARNERYFLKFIFSGEARVGDRVIGFTAAVNAEAGE